MVKFVPYFNTSRVVKKLDKEICDNQSRRAKSHKDVDMFDKSFESVAPNTMSEQDHRVYRPSIPTGSVYMPVNPRDQILDDLMKDLVQINNKLRVSRGSREKPRKEEEPVEKNNDSVEEEEEEEEEETKKEEKQNFIMRLLRPHDK